MMMIEVVKMQMQILRIPQMIAATATATDAWDSCFDEDVSAERERR
jgi:hypothetical protein